MLQDHYLKHTLLQGHVQNMLLEHIDLLRLFFQIIIGPGAAGLAP